MLRRALILLVLLAPTPGHAQADDPAPGMGEGFNLIEEGARLILRGLRDEIDPALRELDGLRAELEGALAGLGDLSGYHPPEVLPNGDILIRRRRPAAAGDPSLPPPDPPHGAPEPVEDGDGAMEL